MNFALNERQRVDLLLNEAIITSRTQTQAKIKEVQKAISDLQEKFTGLSQQITGDMRNTANTVEAEFNRSDIFDQSRHAIELVRHQWENRILDEARLLNEVLVYLLAQVENINWFRDEDGYLIGEAEITSALEEEVLALREKAEVDLELTQLGMAIEVINHEFGHTIHDIRNNLRQLKRWADANSGLKAIYDNLRTNFEHLDGYLTLFTPLHRRLYRQAIEFSGADILDYLERLFNDRMTRHEIELTASPAFRDRKITGYPSTFYPVFVNLVENSIFWLKDQSQPRQISLDADKDGFIITDTGPGISPRDQDAIFELGFTRKPGGRGLGLYISREVLKREGFSLELDFSGEGKKGAVFVLLFPQES
jgi:signal transduction histidine kinase